MLVYRNIFIWCSFILTPCWTFLWVMRADTFALFLTSEEKHLVFHQVMLEDFLQLFFINLRKFSSIPCFQRVFIMNEYWILSDTSVVSTAVIMFFPIFAPLTWLTLLADFQIIYWPCIIGINLAWSYIFIYCSITFVNIFKVVFHFYSWETLVYIFILCLSRIYKFIM